MATITGTRCAKHPKVETGVSCATCGTPICPKCMVYTPVGIKCRECGLSKASPLFKVSPLRLILAFITALAAGVAPAFASRLGMGFLIIFGATAYGYFAGSVILKASGMKRGTKMEAVAGIGMVLGALAFLLIPGLAAGKPLQIVAYRLLNPYLIIAVVISTACAVSKIRYL